MSWICKHLPEFTLSGGREGKGQIGIYIRSLKADAWIMETAPWNTLAKARTGHVSKGEMPLFITVSITAFSWEHDGYGSQGLFYKPFIYLNILCYFYTTHHSLSYHDISTTFYQLISKMYLYLFLRAREQRWYHYNSLEGREILSLYWNTSSSI